MTSTSLDETLTNDKSLRAGLSAQDLETRGYAFFRKVYDKHADRILENMSKVSGGDLDLFACLSIYGELMAETRIINEKETGLLEFTACYATMAAPQAKGYVGEIAWPITTADEKKDTCTEAEILVTIERKP